MEIVPKRLFGFSLFPYYFGRAFFEGIISPTRTILKKSLHNVISALSCLQTFRGVYRTETTLISIFRAQLQCRTLCRPRERHPSSRLAPPRSRSQRARWCSAGSTIPSAASLPQSVRSPLFGYLSPTGVLRELDSS